jgi:dihydroflavonol-4-reductase
MRVLIIGGTGLLGAAGAAELIARGHQVRALSLPPVPPGCTLPSGMELIMGNLLALDDAAVCRLLHGCEALVFAAGVDERVEGPPPVYDLFRRGNLAPLERLLPLAKAEGVRRAVVLGSYFAYFDRVWPDLRLAERHPYIRSRIDQARLALGFSDEQMGVCLLELPYIFGAQPGRRPVWVFLVEQLLAMPGIAFYPRGGTAMVTVRQVGQGIAGAVESGRAGQRYPFGWFNLSWVELLRIMYRHLDQPDKKIVTIPDFLFRLQMRRIYREKLAQGLEPGLNLVEYVRLMTAQTFIDRTMVEHELGVQADDLDRAIGESVRLSLAILQNKATTIDMQSGII